MLVSVRPKCHANTLLRMTNLLFFADLSSLTWQKMENVSSRCRNTGWRVGRQSCHRTSRKYNIVCTDLGSTQRMREVRKRKKKTRTEVDWPTGSNATSTITLPLTDVSTKNTGLGTKRKPNHEQKCDCTPPVSGAQKDRDRAAHKKAAKERQQVWPWQFRMIYFRTRCTLSGAMVYDDGFWHWLLSFENQLTYRSLGKKKKR